jgi:hypothetical protein
MKLVNLFLFAFSLTFSSSSFADFKHEGKLKITYPTGHSTESDLILSYTSQGFEHTFQVGEHKFNVSGKPESYSIAMLLQPNNLVWVQEFAKGQFESFTLDIGDYKFKLVKKILNEPVKGDYILSVNNVDYFFQQSLAQITFLFGDDGIKEIEVDGMVASLGINTAKNECEDMEEGSDERKECEANQ